MKRTLSITEHRPELIILIGIPGSGKSTYADSKRKDYTVISTDEIRQELCGDCNEQSQNKDVFKLFHERIRAALLNGDSVIADATNVTIKSRRSVMACATGIPCSIKGVVMVSTVGACCESDKNRARTVGEEVIKKSVLKFQIPFINEGFDEITFNFENIDYHSTPDIFYIISEHNRELLTISTDILDALTENTYDANLLHAIAFHGVGKPNVVITNEEGEIQFPGYANYGAYFILSECHGLTYPCDILEIAFYINYHTLPYSWKQEKTLNRYRTLFGQQRFDNLMQLHHVIGG